MKLCNQGRRSYLFGQGGGKRPQRTLLESLQMVLNRPASAVSVRSATSKAETITTKKGHLCDRVTGLKLESDRIFDSQIGFHRILPLIGLI